MSGREVFLKPDVDNGFKTLKAYKSIHLITLVDPNYNFIFTYAGLTPSESIKNKSSMFEKCHRFLERKGGKNLPKSEIFAPFIITADDTFPLLENIIPPYPYPYPQTNTKKSFFNSKLDKMSDSAKNAYRLMSTAFRVLRKPMDLGIKEATTVTLVCCYLHNFLMKSTESKILYSPIVDNTENNNEGPLKSFLPFQPYVNNVDKNKKEKIVRDNFADLIHAKFEPVV